MVAVAKHPLSLPTVTLYVPSSPGVANGIVNSAVVVVKPTAPFFQLYVVPPFAVKTIGVPIHGVPLLLTSAFGNGLTSTTAVAVAVHLLMSVTTTW